MMLEKTLDFKAIIFDLDGTLADTMPLHYKACQEVCNARGFEFPLDFFLSEAGRPTTDVFLDLVKRLKLKHDGNELAELKESKFLEILPAVKFIPEVEKIFRAHLGKKKMAIGSGGRKDSVTLTLQALDVENEFDAIVSANDVALHKPHPDTFLKCAELMNVAPHNCIVLEDGDPGITAAKAAGMGIIDIRPYVKTNF